jgi:hypothetical protein
MGAGDMNKIPVSETVTRVLNFATEKLPVILRLTWCPLSLVLLIQLISAYFARNAASAAKMGLGFSFGLFGWSILLALFTIAATSIALVALHRLILFGDEKPGQYVYLSFGKTELLFVGLPVLTYIVMTVLFLVAALVSPWLTFLIALGLVFLFVRMFAIFPIIVVERRCDFEQAWELGRGNVLRFIGLSLVVFVPVMLVVAIVAWLAGMVSAGTGSIGLMLVVKLVLQFVVSIISTALGVGILSYSYKAVKGLPADATLRPGA